MYVNVTRKSSTTSHHQPQQPALIKTITTSQHTTLKHTTSHHSQPHHNTPHHSQPSPHHNTPHHLHHTTHNHNTHNHTTPLTTTPHYSQPHHTTHNHTTPLTTTPHHSQPHHTTHNHTTPQVLFLKDCHKDLTCILGGEQGCHLTSGLETSLKQLLHKIDANIEVTGWLTGLFGGFLCRDVENGRVK